MVWHWQDDVDAATMMSQLGQMLQEGHGVASALIHTYIHVCTLSQWTGTDHDDAGHWPQCADLGHLHWQHMQRMSSNYSVGSCHADAWDQAAAAEMMSNMPAATSKLELLPIVVALLLVSGMNTFVSCRLWPHDRIGWGSHPVRNSACARAAVATSYVIVSPRPGSSPPTPVRGGRALRGGALGLCQWSLAWVGLPKLSALFKLMLWIWYDMMHWFDIIDSKLTCMRTCRCIYTYIYIYTDDILCNV